MKATKTHDLLLLKRVDFPTKIISPIVYKFDLFLVKKNGLNENDQNLMVFEKQTCFWKKLKFEGLWPKFTDYNRWNSKIWCKKWKVFTESFMMLQSHSPCMFVFSSMWEEKKLSHMEAQKSNSHYKSSAKSTYISDSLPRSLRFPSFMVQGPLVSSLGETVAVATFTHYSMVRAEISCRNVNASRCHTALQHIDDSEVWSTIFHFCL